MIHLYYSFCASKPCPLSKHDIKWMANEHGESVTAKHICSSGFWCDQDFPLTSKNRPKTAGYEPEMSSSLWFEAIGFVQELCEILLFWKDLDGSHCCGSSCLTESHYWLILVMKSTNTPTKCLQMVDGFNHGPRIIVMIKFNNFWIFLFCADALWGPACVPFLFYFAACIFFQTKLQWSLGSCHKWRAKTLAIHNIQRRGSG